MRPMPHDDAKQPLVAPPADEGFGLVMVLVWLSLLATLALGVALATSAEPPATAALHERLRLARAAESAVALVVAALAPLPDWSAVPAGPWASPFVDGAPGPRVVGARTIDLAGETHLRTCGRLAPCDAASTASSSPARPWGSRNPRWRLALHSPLAAVDAVAGDICPCYLVAWVGDDPADDDADPDRDAPLGVTGHGILLVRGAAFGERGAVAEVEALVAQPCRRSGTACPGIRVQSWGAVSDLWP
jgi:hypothetical protein